MTRCNENIVHEWHTLELKSKTESNEITNLDQRKIRKNEIKCINEKLTQKIIEMIAVKIIITALNRQGQRNLKKLQEREHEKIARGRKGAGGNGIGIVRDGQQGTLES